MKRSEVISHLKDVYEDFTVWFPEGSYQYLLGHTISPKRGICLVWPDEDQVVTKEIVVAAYQEVVAAGLPRPFLLLGTSKRYNDQSYIFLQLSVEGTLLVFPQRLWKGRRGRTSQEESVTVYWGAPQFFAKGISFQKEGGKIHLLVCEKGETRWTTSPCNR